MKAATFKACLILRTTPRPETLPPFQSKQVLIDMYGVSTLNELFQKRPSALSSTLIGLAQGTDTSIPDNLLILFHETIDAYKGEKTLKNKFLKSLIKQYRAKIGVQLRVNLNKVACTCLMLCEQDIGISSSSSKGKFSQEVTVFINHKKYHDLMLTPILTKVELSPFTPANEQRMWKDELKLASQVCHSWIDLQNIKFCKSNPKHQNDFDICHIVDDFALIDEEDVLKVDFAALNMEPSLAMFHALMASCTKQMRNCLNMYASKIAMQGPRALWYIIKILTTRNTLSLKEFQTELANLGDSLKEHNFDFIKIAPELHHNILDYKEAGGPTFTIYYQVMSPCALFLVNPLYRNCNFTKLPKRQHLINQGSRINPSILLIFFRRFLR